MIFIKRQMLTTLMMVVFLSSVTNGFFWSSSEPEQIVKPQLYAYPLPAIYHQRYIQAQQQIQQNHHVQQAPVQNEELSNQGGIPAIPIQVPLQAQFSPVQNLHNVQLVPCLCPVSPNVEYEKIQEQPSSRVL